MPLLDRHRVHVLVAALALGGPGVLLLFPGSRQAPAAVPEREPTVTAIQHALHAAVMIEADGVYGAGILIDPARGLVITNYHVVQEMHVPRVTTYGGRSADGQLVASDAKRDVALLSVPGLRDASGTPPKLADAATLHPGEEVFAVGMPRKLPFTVSRGIVSFVGRPLEGERFLQVDMNINDGNSGGPVVTSRGEIVGVMSFIYRHAQGLSFALPITSARAAFPDRLPTQLASSP